MTEQETKKCKKWQRRGNKKYHLHFTISGGCGKVECVSTVVARSPRAAVKTFWQGPWTLLELEVDKRGRRRVAPAGGGKPLRKEQINLFDGPYSLFATRREADYRERDL